MHKYHNNNNNIPIQSSLLVDKHTYNTRLSLSNNYFIPRQRTNVALNSLKYLGPKIWQSIPTEFKDSSFFTFKQKFKNHLIQYYNATQ